MGDTVNLFSAKSSSGTVGSRRGSREKSEALGEGFRCRTWSFHQGAQGAGFLPNKILTQHVFFGMMNLVDWWWTDDVWLLQTSVTQKMRALWTIDITEIKRYAMSQDAEGSNPKIFLVACCMEKRPRMKWSVGITTPLLWQNWTSLCRAEGSSRCESPFWIF